jgi:hypothetical protein
MSPLTFSLRFPNSSIARFLFIVLFPSSLAITVPIFSNSCVYSYSSSSFLRHFFFFIFIISPQTFSFTFFPFNSYYYAFFLVFSHRSICFSLRSKLFYKLVRPQKSRTVFCNITVCNSLSHITDTI